MLMLCIPLVVIAQEVEQLAEVLVLPFANETGKKEYQWLSKNIPDAVVDSMQEKFNFKLMTREKFEEIVAISKPKEPVLFSAHTDVKEIVRISQVVNADIIIYGKYNYDATNKTINVKAFVYHRSRLTTTGTIVLGTPVWTNSKTLTIPVTTANAANDTITVAFAENVESFV